MENIENKTVRIQKGNYQEENIVTLDWQEHIRRRPGMYIGKLGDGTSSDDGIYVLLKEVLDNSIDEHMMGYGKVIDVKIDEALLEEVELLQDAILLAVNDALAQIDKTQEETMGQFSGGMGGLGF